MGTNYYWHLSPLRLETQTNNPHRLFDAPDLVNAVYKAAVDSQRRINEEHDSQSLEEGDRHDTSFQLLTTPPKVAALHIGKHSYGWVFGMHIYPELGINTYYEWLTLLPYGKVYNEYREYIDTTLMRGILDVEGTQGQEVPPRPNARHPSTSLDTRYNLYRHPFFADSRFDPNYRGRYKAIDYFTGYFC